MPLITIILVPFPTSLYSMSILTTPFPLLPPLCSGHPPFMNLVSYVLPPFTIDSLSFSLALHSLSLVTSSNSYYYYLISFSFLFLVPFPFSHCIVHFVFSNLSILMLFSCCCCILLPFLNSLFHLVII